MGWHKKEKVPSNSVPFTRLAWSVVDHAAVPAPGAPELGAGRLADDVGPHAARHAGPHRPGALYEPNHPQRPGAVGRVQPRVAVQQRLDGGELLFPTLLLAAGGRGRGEEEEEEEGEEDEREARLKKKATNSDRSVLSIDLSVYIYI